MWSPLTFHPIVKERVWGGRRLAELFGKALPPGRPIGESWEICDRPGDVSVVATGPWAGRSLHALLAEFPREMLGPAALPNGRFPLLVKILDAQDVLSLQVHPPAHLAATLGGEPKTELWFVAAATPDAVLYAGLRRGTTREAFTRRLHDGSVADCFHRLSVRSGDAMFLPSGRVHAIGAGNVIFEIQENSDTTYRVFDWNRLGLDGQPRALHLAESLQCIDFGDFEPALLRPRPTRLGDHQVATLVEHPLFSVQHWTAETASSTLWPQASSGRVLGVIRGSVVLEGGTGAVTLTPGSFAFLPAVLPTVRVAASGPHEFLLATPGPPADSQPRTGS